MAIQPIPFDEASLKQMMEDYAFIRRMMEEACSLSRFVIPQRQPVMTAPEVEIKIRLTLLEHVVVERYRFIDDPKPVPKKTWKPTVSHPLLQIDEALGREESP